VTLVTRLTGAPLGACPSVEEEEASDGDVVPPDTIHPRGHASQTELARADRRTFLSRCSHHRRHCADGSRSSNQGPRFVADVARSSSPTAHTARYSYRSWGSTQH